jgi:hypothetical protein
MSRGNSVKLNINGTFYEWDWSHVPIRDAMMLKTATGMNMTPLARSFDDLDPECLLAVAWVALTKAGVKGPDGQPLKLADVPDFDMNSFIAIDIGDLDDDDATNEKSDPTGGGTEPGVSPDSIPPEPSTATD